MHEERFAEVRVGRAYTRNILMEICFFQFLSACPPLPCYVQRNLHVDPSGTQESKKMKMQKCKKYEIQKFPPWSAHTHAIH